MKKEYQIAMHPRLMPTTTWAGGRITDTDVLKLPEAAAMASKHANKKITVQDILRAAARGEIRLLAVVHRTARLEKYDGGIYCNKGTSSENLIPKGAIPTLPVFACRQLANSGRASWREIDGYETVDGELMRYHIANLANDEPDYETMPDDCRVTGYDIHALADAFAESQVISKPDGCDLQPWDITEAVYNGEPVDWHYWAARSKISPRDAAKLAYRIDPMRWPSDRCAAGPFSDDLRIKLAKLEGVLAERSGSFTVAEFSALLGDSFGTFGPTVATSEQLDHSQISDSTSKLPKGLNKTQILTAFESAVGDRFRLRKSMGDPKIKWLFEANISKGTRGRGGHEAQWNPLLLAIALHEKGYIQKTALNRAFFQHKFLAEWRDEWREHEESLE